VCTVRLLQLFAFKTRLNGKTNVRRLVQTRKQIINEVKFQFAVFVVRLSRLLSTNNLDFIVFERDSLQRQQNAKTREHGRKEDVPGRGTEFVVVKWSRIDQFLSRKMPNLTTSGDF
jgi:hypothetical protein